ncbi:L-asparaginase [Formivibrio citricus]|uniref:L-asparaginase n=1 Tax=Formivibrio citricus TaxID=83765 RepID=A0A1I5BIW3_9NEIS|nr:asparaginase [Formivibrio citricus]SFN74576.1 L-asparaginase [Formivibrio citricus]
MKRILCLYTGGTIGCLPTENGLAPAPGILSTPLQALAAGHALEVTLQEYPQLLDSSSMGPADWNRIGQDIAIQYDAFDGFVVLHGTDTLAYTAAALSFQLENLGKPVIVTGSQRPWLQDASDAPANVALALTAAASGIAGVRVAFGGKLLPGNGVRKVDADGDTAFDAPNWNGEWPAPRNSGDLRFTAIDPTSRVVGIKLYPGTSYDWLAQSLVEPLQGIVLETYGSGNLPDHAGLIAALEKQAAAGAIIVNCTQCLRGMVRQGRYASSSALARIGALPAEDMTPEAALVKLYCMLAKTGA